MIPDLPIIVDFEIIIHNINYFSFICNTFVLYRTNISIPYVPTRISPMKYPGTLSLNIHTRAALYSPSLRHQHRKRARPQDAVKHSHQRHYANRSPTRITRTHTQPIQFRRTVFSTCIRARSITLCALSLASTIPNRAPHRVQSIIPQAPLVRSRAKNPRRRRRLVIAPASTTAAMLVNNIGRRCQRSIMRRRRLFFIP